MRRVLLFIVAGCLLWMATSVAAAELCALPHQARAYRATLIRSAHALWGMDAPVAVFAAQIHAESRWNVHAKSRAGAMGLAQFMPATAAWMPELDRSLANPAPYNPGWAIRAMLIYDRWLWKRWPRIANDHERMAFSLAEYNGGRKYLLADLQLAGALGYDRERWFGHVERCNGGRSTANFRENRQYPQKILRRYQQCYVKDGWGPGLEGDSAEMDFTNRAAPAGGQCLLERPE